MTLIFKNSLEVSPEMVHIYSDIQQWPNMGYSMLDENLPVYKEGHEQGPKKE